MMVMTLFISITISFHVPVVSSCFALPLNPASRSSSCAAAAVIPSSSPLLSALPTGTASRTTRSVKQGVVPKLRAGSSSSKSTSALSASASSSSSSSSSAAAASAASAAQPPPQPTLQDLIKFALPCLGLWISGPLLSLVDTASVGLTAKPGMGATDLGALGPATTFIDGATYLFAFLNVATTNLYASALAKNTNNKQSSGINNNDKQNDLDNKLAADAVVRTAVKISLICGFAIMTLLFTQGQTLLRLYVGEQSAKQILLPATQYVHIRALSLPTSLLAGVLQAALLGSKDSVTPLIAVIVSTLINVFGDGLLVVALGMGTAGAAIATTAAQWGGTAAMFRPARNKLLVSSSTSSASSTSSTSSTTTAITPEQRAQHKVTSKSFLAFAAPVLTLILGKIAAFGVMTHVAAALPGDTSLAAHQIILSLFFFVSPFLEVLSQTAQAFLPQYYVEKASVAFDLQATKLAARLLRLGMIVGAGIACIASSIPAFFPFILTNDALVQNSVKPLALPLFLGSLLTAPVAVSEGVLLARRELKYLAGVYMLSTIVFPFGLFSLKKTGGPVSNVWFGFVFFQLFRALCFTGKLWGRALLGKIGSLVGLNDDTNKKSVVA